MTNEEAIRVLYRWLADSTAHLEQTDAGFPGSVKAFLKEKQAVCLAAIRALEKAGELREALKGAMVIAEEAKSVVKAKKDGRLVELPCRVGDTVYEAVREWDGRDCVRSASGPASRRRPSAPSISRRRGIWSPA